VIAKVLIVPQGYSTVLSIDRNGWPLDLLTSVASVSQRSTSRQPAPRDFEGLLSCVRAGAEASSRTAH
jgi:hypothetical protein